MGNAQYFLPDFPEGNSQQEIRFMYTRYEIPFEINFGTLEI